MVGSVIEGPVSVMEILGETDKIAVVGNWYLDGWIILVMICRMECDRRAGAEIAVHHQNLP